MTRRTTSEAWEDLRIKWRRFLRSLRPLLAPVCLVIGHDPEQWDHFFDICRRCQCKHMTLFTGSRSGIWSRKDGAE